jgi:transposase
VEHRATVRALALTAQRVLTARQDAHQLEGELRQLVTVMAPALLTQPGIGPISAAQLLIRSITSQPGAYTSRRTAQGKSQREIRRCLKGTVARQLYRLLERNAIDQPAVDAN